MASMINEITALLAMLLLLLVLRGLGPGLIAPANRSIQHLSRGMFITGCAIVLRFAYWDFLFEIAMRIRPESAADLRMVGVWINGAANMMLVAGSFFVLRALLERIPASQRSHWNIITVAFYPSGIRLFSRADRERRD